MLFDAARQPSGNQVATKWQPTDNRCGVFGVLLPSAGGCARACRPPVAPAWGAGSPADPGRAATHSAFVLPWLRLRLLLLPPARRLFRLPLRRARGRAPTGDKNSAQSAPQCAFRARKRLKTALKTPLDKLLIPCYTGTSCRVIKIEHLRVIRMSISE